MGNSVAVPETLIVKEVPRSVRALIRPLKGELERKDVAGATYVLCQRGQRFEVLGKLVHVPPGDPLGRFQRLFHSDSESSARLYFDHAKPMWAEIPIEFDDRNGDDAGPMSPENAPEADEMAREAVPETLTVSEVAACAALVAAPELGLTRLALRSFDASMAGLFDAIDEGPLSEFHERGLSGYMALLAASWIFYSLPDDTRIPVCPSLRFALEQKPELLGLVRRFLEGQAVSVPIIKGQEG